jgi:hypothetical protein
MTLVRITGGMLRAARSLAGLSYFARQAQTPAAPKLKVSDDRSGATEVGPDHPDPRMGLSLLAEALATTDVSFVVGLISQLADAGTRRGKVGERELNFMLAVVTGAKSKDQMEAMLAAQMAAVHMATMALARRLANVENTAQQDSAEHTGFLAAPLGKHFELLECSGLSCGNQRINALQSSFRDDDLRSLVIPSP